MNYKEMIEEYKTVTQEFDLSVFEAVEGLHIRTELYEEYNNLSQSEKALLLDADVEVINNVKKIVKHIKKAYNFAKSTESKEQWWWHLDKVASGELSVTFYVQTETKDMDL